MDAVVVVSSFAVEPSIHCAQPVPRAIGDSARTAEGTRTLDLLHAKRRASTPSARSAPLDRPLRLRAADLRFADSDALRHQRHAAIAHFLRVSALRTGRDAARPRALNAASTGRPCGSGRPPAGSSASSRSRPGPRPRTRPWRCIRLTLLAEPLAL